MGADDTDSDLATIAALKSLNWSLQTQLGAQQFANSLILQVMVNLLAHKLGSDFRPTLVKGLKDTWEVMHRTGATTNSEAADQCQELLQDFINSLENK